MPVLVIRIVAVAGWPAFSFVLGELGTPLLVTGTGAKLTAPGERLAQVLAVDRPELLTSQRPQAGLGRCP